MSFIGLGLWHLILFSTISQLHRDVQLAVSGKNYRPPVSHRQTLSHYVVLSTTPRHEWG